MTCHVILAHEVPSVAFVCGRGSCSRLRMLSVIEASARDAEILGEDSKDAFLVTIQAALRRTIQATLEPTIRLPSEPVGRSNGRDHSVMSWHRSHHVVLQTSQEDIPLPTPLS